MVDHRKRKLGATLLAALLTVTLAPSAALGVAPVDGGAITVWPFQVSFTTGANDDPHVDGWFASFTSGDRVHLFDVFIHQERVIPGPAGTTDAFSDISAARIVFARASAAGSTIMLYDIAADTTIEIDPQPSASRTAPAFGGDTVAFIDLAASPDGELFATRLGGATSRITTDTRTDRSASVAGTGNLIAFESCASSSTGCDVRQAAWNGAAWTVAGLASTADEETNPDTDGSVVVYEAVRSGDRDIFWQPAGGGAEQRIALPGEQRNPAVSDGIVTFESLAPGAASWNVEAYQIATNRVYDVASTTANEWMADVDILSDGTLRVLWVTGDASQRDVLAADFGLPTPGGTVVQPLDGGAFAAFHPVAIDEGAGDQYDPHVSGDLASYSNIPPTYDAGIGLYDFVTGSPTLVPSAAEVDENLSDVADGRVAFMRYDVQVLSSGIDVYDVASGLTTTLEALSSDFPGDPAIGGNTVAWIDMATGHYVLTISRNGGTPTALQSGDNVDDFPSVDPTGDLVVYMSCLTTGRDCDVLQASWNGTSWATTTLATSERHGRVDTDGNVVVYEAFRDGQSDIYWQPVGGGTERRLSFAGLDRHPAVSGGVISFSSTVDFHGQPDLYLYEIATNRLFRVTSTPFSEVLNDISRLPDGRVRVVWDTRPTSGSARDVYGATIELPPVGPTYQFGGFVSPVDAPPTLNQLKAGAAVPVKFGIGGDQGLAIFAAGYPKSQSMACDATAPVDGIEETVSAGGSSLTYDPATGLYAYVWKTDRAWAGTCRQLVLKFADGSVARAGFKFR